MRVKGLESTALATLRRDLTNLRQALGPAADRLRSPTPRSLCLELAEGEADVLAFDAAVAMGFAAARDRLFAGEIVNPSEGRPATHVAERGSGAGEDVDLATARRQRTRALVNAIARLSARDLVVVQRFAREERYTGVWPLA